MSTCEAAAGAAEAALAEKCGKFEELVQQKMDVLDLCEELMEKLRQYEDNAISLDEDATACIAELSKSESSISC